MGQGFDSRRLHQNIFQGNLGKVENPTSINKFGFFLRRYCHVRYVVPNDKYILVLTA